MKKEWAFSMIAILVLLLLSITACANDRGVDDLRGQWQFVWVSSDNETPPPLSLFINDIEPGQEANTYLAAGCMQSSSTNSMYPLSLMAIYEPDTNTYSLSIYSTVMQGNQNDPSNSPYVIHFSGTFKVNGSSVNDDLAYGDFRSGGPTGTWQGIHNNRRRTKCPPVDTHGERLETDLSAHSTLDEGIESAGYAVEANGITIASSALRVTAPDGQVIIAPMYTDIWSPDADFEMVFRFRQEIDGALPITGQPYQFVLLDIFGDPISGTETQDTWTHCGDAAPTMLQFDPNPAYEEDVILSWVGIDNVPGEFVPGEIGYYQFSIDPADGHGNNYGADNIGETYHVIPWIPFNPGDEGSPGGRNVGTSLMDLEDGEYWINLYALYEANPSYGGFGLECTVSYRDQAMRMEKLGSKLIFSSP